MGFIQKSFLMSYCLVLFFLFQTPFLFATWTTPVDLSAVGQNASAPQVVMNDSGQAVAIWERGSCIQVAILAFGGSWSSPVDLSASEDTSTNPQVAINANGQAVAVWRRKSGSSYDVQSATVTFGGSWSVATSLFALSNDALTPQVAINDLGQTIVVWSRNDGTNYLVESATLAFGGSWSSSTILSASGADATDPQVVINDASQIVVAWIRNDTVEADTCSFESSWCGKVSLSTQPLVELLVVLLDSSGNVKVSWRRSLLNYLDYEMATYTFGGSWGNPIFLTKSVVIENLTKVLLSNNDNVVVYLINSDGMNMRMRVWTYTNNSGWSLGEDLSAAGENASEAGGNLNNFDQAVMIWSCSNGTNTIIQASTKSI